MRPGSPSIDAFISVVIGVLTLLPTLAVTGGTAHALDPAFFGSTIVVQPPAIVAGETFEATFTFVFAGDGSPLLFVRIPIPTDVLLADGFGNCPAARWDPLHREVRYEATLLKDQVWTCRVHLIVRPEASQFAELRMDLSTGIKDDGLVLDLPIEQPSSPILFRIAGMGVTPAAAMVLAVFFSTGLTLLGQRRRPFLLALVALTFLYAGLALMTLMIYYDLDVLLRYEPADCSVEDALQRRAFVPGEERIPVVALHDLQSVTVSYMASGTRRHSLARWMASRLPGDGGSSTTERPLPTGARSSSRLDQGYALSTAAVDPSERTCWYDPSHPERVVLSRRPGMSYLFVMVMMVVLPASLYRAVTKPYPPGSRP